MTTQRTVFVDAGVFQVIGKPFKVLEDVICPKHGKPEIAIISTLRSGSNTPHSVQLLAQGPPWTFMNKAFKWVRHFRVGLIENSPNGDFHHWALGLIDPIDVKGSIKPIHRRES
ncbi:hypothetical protein H1C71_022410 [Ictidomys tridecemlineatus]|nr:hypothetical protein H1C71_022410 [Ictidomys tridecemlineatus]